MKKKIVLTLLLAAFVVGGAFAQIGMSIGGGAFFDFSGNNGVKYTGDNKDFDGYYTGIRNLSIGAFGFFDVTYAELSVNFAYGSLSPAVSGKYMGETLKLSKEEEDIKTSVMQFGFSVLGKYPINMEGVTIFPMLGVDYNIVLSGKSKYKDEEETMKSPGDYSQFGFLGGIGADINISGPLFVRLEGLLHMRLPSKVMKDSIKGEMKNDLKATWGIGPQIKVAIGYKF